MARELRGGKLCHTCNLTLTTKDPTTFEQGMRNTSYLMAKQKTFQDYVLYPEYSDQGMFHFHGTIWYTNKLHFMSFLNLWRRDYGFVKPTPDNNHVKWSIYCRKDQWLIDGKHIKYKRIHKYNVKQLLLHYL